MSAPPPTSKSHIVGIAIAAAGAILISFSALLIRQIETATGWQVIFYRSLGLFAGMLVLFGIRNWGGVRASLREAFRPSVVAGPFQGLASIFYIMALTHTTIANTLLTLAATPLVVAAIGWMVLRERITLVTLGALLAAGLGIVLMTVDGIATGMGLGSLFAIVNVICFALYIVLLRRASRSGDVDMLPAAVIGALVAAGVSLMRLPSFEIEMRDLLICLAWGAGVQTIGIALIMASARFISAGEISLMLLIESVFGPLWAWIFVGEIPRTMTIVGGAVTLSAITAWILIRMQQERASRRLSLTAPTEATL